MTYYIHQTPGRLRVCTPALKDRPEAAATVRTSLSGIAGVHSVRSNPTTGSVIVLYDTRAVSPGTLINRLAAEKLLTGVIGFPAPVRKRMQRASFAQTRPPSALALALNAAQKPRAAPVSPQARALLRMTVRLILPFVAERAFGKMGRVVVSAFL